MDISKAPLEGTMYALYKDRVEFKPYNKADLSKDIADGLLELHLFDESTEYRYIKTRKGEIEKSINDESADFDDKYIETIFTLNSNCENIENQGIGEKHDIIEVINSLYLI